MRRQPAATAVTPSHPETSHCPSPFQPVARTVPSARSPTVWDRPVFRAAWTFPAATATIPRHRPTRHSPAAVPPTATTAPSRRRATE